MAKLAYYLRVDAQDCAAEILLNGAPMLAGPASFPWSAVPAVSEWVIAGDNKLGARVLELGAAPRLRISLCQGEVGVAPDDENELELGVVELLIPDGTPPPGAPFELTATAFANHGWGRWYWQDAPSFNADRHSRQDLFDFLQRIHASLAAGSTDLLFDASRLKFRDLCSCYGGTLAEIEAELRGVFGALSQLPGWELAPLDPADLELLLRADGRLVQPVTRRGKPALRQIHRDQNGVETDEPGWSLTIFIARLDPKVSSRLGVLR